VSKDIFTSPQTKDDQERTQFLFCARQEDFEQEGDDDD